MPIKNENSGQLFCEINGKVIQINGMPELSIEENVEIYDERVASKFNYSKSMEIEFKMQRKSRKNAKRAMQGIMPRYFTNNWRKMHHLSLIRRKGMRK